MTTANTVTAVAKTSFADDCLAVKLNKTQAAVIDVVAGLHNSVRANQLQLVKELHGAVEAFGAPIAMAIGYRALVMVYGKDVPRQRVSELRSLVSMPKAQFEAIMASGKFGTLATVVLGGKGAFDADGVAISPKDKAPKTPGLGLVAAGALAAAKGEAKAKPATQLAAILAQLEALDTSGFGKMGKVGIAGVIADIADLLAIVK